MDELKRIAAETALVKAMRDLAREIRRIRKEHRELHDDDDDGEDA